MLGPARQRAPVTRKHHEEAADADIVLQRDHLVGEMSRQEQGLAVLDDEPSRARHGEKGRQVEGGLLAVGSGTLDVLEIAGDALERVPYQPELSAGEAVIAAVGNIAV